MKYECATTRDELVQYILDHKSHVMGSAARKGMLYQEIPFAGYDKLSVHRMHSAKRVQLISKYVDMQGKTVLDIGCNIGHFCFEFARLGATCWGIDYDADAIFVARSLKQIHSVSNVHFVSGDFSVEMISSLLDQAGKFDVLLLNSIVHWLLYSNYGSLRRVAKLLNFLVSPEKQYIVYEPSSSGQAYYPEVLRKKGIKEFFHLLGVDSYHQIGVLVASNVKRKRAIWLGERNIHAIVHNVHDLLSQKETRADVARVVYTKGDKICFKYKSLFIKTVATENSVYNFLLRNELEVVKRLACHTDRIPVLIIGTEFEGRVYLVYEWIEGHLLARSFVSRQDVDWITQEIFGFLRELEWSGLVHNDLHSRNVFLLPKSKSILVIDCEHSGPRFDLADRPKYSEKLLLVPPLLAKEKDILADQFVKIGQTLRSPFGTGCYEHDHYTANRMIFDFKNRSRYAYVRVVNMYMRLLGWFIKKPLGRELAVLYKSYILKE